MAISRSMTASALFLVFLFSTPSFAQHLGNSTVVFTCDFPASDPSHYEVSISPGGGGSYSSQPRAVQDAGSDPKTEVSAPEVYRTDFRVSSTTASRIFDFAKRANYFSGNFDSGKKKIASTGMKTLVYRSPDRSTSTAYNYSENSAIQELTSTFQDLSITLEFGRRLDYDLRFQKTAIEAELKSMEEMQGGGSLVEVSAVAPILQKIADDQSIMNISRSRALRLLAKSGIPK